MKKIIALLAVLTMLGTASAAISVDYTATSLGNGTTAYIITATADNGIVSSFDGAFTGSMVQVKVFGFMDTPDLTYRLNCDLSGDSHFLFMPGDITATVAPYETETTLGGNISFQNSDASIDIAQIVLVDGETASLDCDLYDGLNNKTSVVMTIHTPEPATLGLLTIGLIGLLRKHV